MTLVDYRVLDADTIRGYLADDPVLRGLVDVDALEPVHEIGDGNLNLVFVVRDLAGHSLVLKQALPYVRMVGPVWPMSPRRAWHEAHALRTHGALAPDRVPRLYAYDEANYVLALEDLSDHTVWRTALNAGRRHEGAAAGLGEYVAEVAFGTSALGLDSAALKALQAESVNPPLCAITEDLVFTEPFAGADRNSVLPANAPDAAALLADADVVAEMGLAKWTFMTRAEALVHGDLHTGSVMVRAAGGAAEGPVDSVRAFDSEFSFHGPVAFDLGALWANYVLAASRAVALGDDRRAAWALSLIGETWEAFERRFRDRWPHRVDPRVFTDGVREGLLDRWRSEAWLFGAAEAARRIVGMAKVADVETLPEDVRVGAARGVLQVTRHWVRERHVDADPGRAARIAGDLLTEHRTA